MLKGLAPLALEWRPDLVVADAAELDIYPPALRNPGGVHVQRRQALRPIAYDGSPDGPVPLPNGAAGSPLVYVTMGTVFNDAGPLRAAVDAIAALEARVLVTVGPFADPDVLGRQPDHVRVERYVPQTALLPHCNAVVSHAGSGTVLATLALGIPQLCLPQGADQFLNASAVAAAGAGISVPPDRATPEAIADAVGRLLGDPAFGDAAKEVAASIDDMPPPEEVAGVLESFV